MSFNGCYPQKQSPKSFFSLEAWMVQNKWALSLSTRIQGEAMLETVCQSEKSAAAANQSSGCRDLSKCTRLPNYNVALSQCCVFRGGIITVDQESSQKTKESQGKGEKVFSPFSRTFLSQEKSFVPDAWKIRLWHLTDLSPPLPALTMLSSSLESPVVHLSDVVFDKFRNATFLTKFYQHGM